jgi:hypothetical protein
MAACVNVGARCINVFVSVINEFCGIEPQRTNLETLCTLYWSTSTHSFTILQHYSEIYFYRACQQGTMKICRAVKRPD